MHTLMRTLLRAWCRRALLLPAGTTHAVAWDRQRDILTKGTLASSNNACTHTASMCPPHFRSCCFLFLYLCLHGFVCIVSVVSPRLCQRLDTRLGSPCL